MNNQKVVHLKVFKVGAVSLAVQSIIMLIFDSNVPIYFCSSIIYSPNIYDEQFLNSVRR